MRKKQAIFTAFAFSAGLINLPAQAVAINPDGFGQVLLAPIYDAFDGFINVVRVTNTSLTDAVKTKVTLRSAVDQRECASLLLYLTPADTAQLNIVPHPDNRFAAALFSDDDSLIASMQDGAPSFATAEAPYRGQTVSADLFRPATNIVNGRPNGDHCAIGHLEVVGAYAVRGLVHTPSGDVTVKSGMAKGDLYKIFSTSRAKLNTLNPTNQPRSTIAPGTADWGRIALNGIVDLTLNAAGDRITVPMVPLVSGAASADFLIGNEFLDVAVGASTDIGLGWGPNYAENLPAIEDALNTRSFQAIYDNTPSRTTNLIITFPTKYRHLASKSPVDYTRPFGRPSPFNVDGSVEYDETSFDMRGFEAISQGCYEISCKHTSTYFISDGSSYIWTGIFWPLIASEQSLFSLSFIGPNPPVPAIGYLHRITNGSSAIEAMMRK